MTIPSIRIVIVGAGHAGGSAAAFLRQFGHSGPLTLIGAEPHLPYQRPPLSKAYLKGTTAAESLLLRPLAYYAERDIELVTSCSVRAIDALAQTVTTDDGRSFGFDVLILATGSTARRLTITGSELASVHHLRDIADADALREHMAPGHRLAIIGGGYVGLEAAASARQLGAEVVIIEREARLLARVAAAPLAEFFAAYHRARGVEIITGADIVRLEGAHGNVSAVVLGDGRRIACDAVLVGIGGQACDSLAASAGLACNNGVIVDAEARTSDPHIYAIGDMTLRPLPLDRDRPHRLESVPNAVEQARRAANAILGLPQPPHELPWFWSDQYDLKLQIAGLPFDTDAIVVRGDPAAAKFAVYHLRGGKVRAVEAVNSIPDFMGGKALITSGRQVDPARLSDTAVPVKTLVAELVNPC
jgi:3-phenylpropionate/trans-cinnamate dioxygenase ferredoxin reductase subunit